ncbi:UDP-glucose 4-epimerase family protein [Marinobacter mangrovi]|uniref:UDP-glucose 4-epimerase family protein n=1 Tax=Marinobacter mangrovi TaxID=2803918 RepID=UPI001932F5B6|nr:SDR family oxidoreductase [Marinobacter mangrovi]
MTRVLVTGASGFVGGALLRRLADDDNVETVAAIRNSSGRIPCADRIVAGCVLGNECTSSGWDDALRGVDVVVHCAARVHIMNDTATDPLDEFRRINVTGTLKLAELAAKAGVRRFVFVSTVKVNGEATRPGEPFRETDTGACQDDYGLSKSEAEAALRTLADKTGMEVTIVRPPLVYGPGVKGNFKSLYRLATSGLPLPLGAINNLRSLIYIGNLSDFLALLVHHPKAGNDVFLVSDGDDLSTTSLLRCFGQHSGKRVRLFYFPAVALFLLGRMLGRKSVVDRLCGSLQVSIEKAQQRLSWQPPFTVSEGIRSTVSELGKEDRSRNERERGNFD